MSISKAQAVNFILYIKCTKEQDFNYNNPLTQRLKKEIASADHLDLDNFSEPYLIDQACKAMETCERVCVVFNLAPESNTKPFLRLATWLADHPEKSLVFVNGKDELISKLLFAQEGFCYYDLEEKKSVEMIRKFLKE